jgi:hypothetical protein
MASPGELVQIVSEVLKLPQPTVVVHDRNLVIAGLRSKGGRGRAAAQVAPRDVAHLLVALLASGEVRDSVHSVERYTATQPAPDTSSKKLFAGAGVPELAALSPSHSFVDALEALLISATTGWLSDRIGNAAASAQRRTAIALPSIEIAASTPGTLGDIRIAGLGRHGPTSVRYRLPDPFAFGRSPGPADLKKWEATMKRFHVDTDFKQSRDITERSLFAIAARLKPEE